MIEQGTRIEILPEYQDEGDEKFIWITASDEEKGRIDVKPINTGMSITPVLTLNTYMIELAAE